MNRNLPEIFPELTPNAALTENTQRGNLNVQFDRRSRAVVVSECWRLAARLVQFLWLPANSLVRTPRDQGICYAKVVIGSLVIPARLPFCQPRALQNTQLDVDDLKAGDDGALVAVFLLPEGDDGSIQSLDDLAIKGPKSDALQWRTFHQHFARVTDISAGVDAYIGPGFRLLDEDGSEITTLTSGPQAKAWI